MPPATPGATPGKKRERAYVLFNDNPREKGTLSGRPMPTDIPINDDGFEDPGAFMKSPTASLTNSASRRTTMGAPSSVGTSRRMTIGRMSQLDDGSDEDELHLGLDAALVDDEFDAANSTFFDVSNPTRVPLPRRSELAPATPGTNVDDLPSPSVSISRSATKSVSKRKSNLGGSPNQISRRSIATTVNHSPLGNQSLEYDGDSMLLNDEDPNLSPRSRRQSRRDTILTEDGGEPSIDHGRHRNDRKSMASRKSYASEPNLDDLGGDDDDDDPEQSYAFDNGPADDGGGEDSEEELADEEQAEAEIALEDEQDPVEGSDEDTGEETAVERPRSKVKKGKTTRTKTVQRRPRDSSSSSTSPIKRARVSGFPLVPEEDEDLTYKGDFKCRRSGRSHIKPLKWWRGDHLEYEPGEYQAEVKEIVRKPEDVKTLAKKRTYRKTSKRPRESTDLDDGTGHDNETLSIGTVMDFASNQQVEDKWIAMPHRRLKTKPVDGGKYEYEKVFGEDTFAAAGVIRIPAGSKKPGKSSRDNAFFFFVHKGGLNVNIHLTSFNMGPGAMFYVPRGNKYSIENISQVEAELFFAQARKSDTRAEEEQTMERFGSEAPSAVKVKAKGKKIKTNFVEPETEAESTPASKKKKKSGKK